MKHRAKMLISSANNCLGLLVEALREEDREAIYTQFLVMNTLAASLTINYDSLCAGQSRRTHIMYSDVMVALSHSLTLINAFAQSDKELEKHISMISSVSSLVMEFENLILAAHLRVLGVFESIFDKAVSNITEGIDNASGN